MSDSSVHDGNGRDIEPVEAALERLHRGWDSREGVGELDAEAREYLEVLALLADDVEEIEPSPSVKAGLFEQIGADREQPTSSREPAGQVVAFPEPSADRSASSTPSWLVPALAAGLALCLVGLGYFYGQFTNLQGQLRGQSALIAEQREQVEASQELQFRLIETQREVADLHERLAMVDTIAQTAYPLRATALGAQLVSTSGDAPHRAPDGRVYVCGQHQRWYLTAQHLEPAPEGREYHLWFMTEQGAIDAGVVEVSGAGSALLRNLTMPKGTHGFAITLEAVGMEGDEPHGPMILQGDEPVRL
ncbi:MAG: anti-sigma factor [Acidobacteriota bacterium]